MKPRDLEQHIQDAFDGRLSDRQACALRQELLNSPHALELYCDHALLDAELRRLAANRSKIPGAISARSSVAAAARQRKQVLLSLSAAAAVLLLTAVVLRLSIVRPLAEMELSPRSTLTAENGSEFAGSSLRRGQTVRLCQGVAKLTLASGVDAVIEGPATFRLLGENEMELSSGHSWFHVPQKARGFRIVSPQLELVDLGTEFGIDLREDLRPQIHVLKGSVETTARFGRREKVGLRAGEAATLSPEGGWDRVPPDSRKFREYLPPSLPVLRMDFESMDGDELPMEGDMIGVKGASARIIRPDRARLIPGIAGNALELDGDGACIETTWPGISGSAPRTLALWCRIPKGVNFQTAPPLAWWGNPGEGVNRKFKVALLTQPDGRTTLRASFGEVLFDGSSDLADGEWHHLAAVYRGNLPDGLPDISFFVDGRPDAISQPPRSSTDDELPIDTDKGSMGIGKYELPAQDRNPYLKATIDEFRIFAGALRDDEIRSLATPR